MSMKIANLAGALISLSPGAQWAYENEDYDTIEWKSSDIPKPSKEAVEAEIIRLQKEIEDEAAQSLQEEAARQAAKESAVVKLAKLGLTPEEAAAIVGA